MSGDSDTTPVWKKLYHIISGGNTTVTQDIVEEILKLCRDKAVQVFFEFGPYTRRSLQLWKQQSGLKEIVADDEMCNFIHLLSKELNLDVNIAWTVMCNFLMFEYFGKIDELKLIIRYEANVRCLIENVWYFYSADRMFLLKSLRHIFENVLDTEYKFHKQFDDFVKSVDKKLLWKNLMYTMDKLITEINADRAEMVSKEVLPRWIHRNNREQVEVVTLLTHMVQYLTLDGHELEDVLELFLKHGFTRHLFYPESTKISRPIDLSEIKCAEIGCVLVLAERYWQCPGTAKLLPKSIEKSVEMLQIQGDHTIVLLAWAVLKTSISNTEEAMEYCNSTINELIQKRVFKSLHNLLVAKIFDKCKSGDIVVNGVFRLMAEFIKICADYTYLHEQDGVCYVTAELLKRKGLVVLDYLGTIFQLSMDAFPFVFNPFLEMCKSMLAIPDQYVKVMQLLKEIPTFLSEIPWTERRDSFYLSSPQRIFSSSDLFIVPENTLVEKFSYQGTDFAKFRYSFSFFLLLEQFTKSLSIITLEIGKSYPCYDNLMELVQIGFKFVINILKIYEGDFRADSDLKRLVKLLDIVPAQFCEGPTRNINLIRIYFETNVTLITHDLLEFSEVFSPIFKKRFLPQATNHNKVDKQFFNQILYDCILLKTLKEEEGMTDHNLLIEYLKLIQYVVEKDIYHQEVQLAGVWYILNVVFPLHQQWPYEDEFQMMTVCKSCVTICVKVLQNTELEQTDKRNEIINMCRDAFMFDEVLMCSYLSVFYKDKFYIQNLMQHESNWIDGPVLEQIENVRVQMVLLLLIYKFRIRIPSTTKCSIDNKINLVTKAISAHMVNPYNATLRILSYRFLEILAKDESIPMMALLGLDYDQVQRLFLDKLRDPMEDDNVKMQILELISTCIFSQHGMTAALFNITRSRRWHSDFREKQIEGDTVTDFMIDYLQNIKKSLEYLKSPLQVAILRVMSNLWLCGKRHLIKDIIALDEFWPLLVDPLFQEYKHSPSVYAFIFKILAIHLSDTTGDRTQFLTTVRKFTSSEKLLMKWKKYMVTILSDSQLQICDVEEKEFLLRSWVEFVMMSEKEEVLKITCEKSKLLFIELCLDGIQWRFANEYCLDIWMNMCLLFMSNWGFRFKTKEGLIIDKVTKMFNTIKLRYPELVTRTRAIILTIALRVIKKLKKYLEHNTVDLLNFLEELGAFVDHEYDLLDKEIWVQVTEGSVGMRELMIPWMMCIHIANRLLDLKTALECRLWFAYRNYLQRIIKCTADLISKPQTLPLTKIALYSLQLYVDSPLVLDFLNVDMTSFYDSIEPPLTALFAAQRSKLHMDETEEAWLTCTLLMKFNYAFYQRFQYTALPTFYGYIKLHEQILQQIMLIPECTVAIKALDLLLNTLVFFNSIIMNWQEEWYQRSNVTYSFIMNGVKKIVNSCLYIILRPKNVVIYSQDDYHRLNQIDIMPMSLMVVVMNRLISITGLCFSMLYHANPNLIDTLGILIKDSPKILIQNDFSVPKFELPIPFELTYGKLLCLAHFMCKTLDALGYSTSDSEEDDSMDEYPIGCIGLVEHQDSVHNFPSDKLGAYLRYAMYEYSGLADPWIHRLSQPRVKKAFEVLMTFLAQQVYLCIRTGDPEGLPYFKRNLATELQFFYEHVKRHTSMSFGDQIAGSSRSMATYKDMDIVNRVLVYFQRKNKYLDVVDSNFGLVLVHWFTTICRVH